MRSPHLQFYPIATFWLVTAIVAFIIAQLVFHGEWVGVVIGFLVLSLAAVLTLVAVHKLKG